MFLHHVRNFVRQHPGQLRLIVEQVEQATRDHDVAAGRGEGVDSVRVDDAESPGQVRSLTAGSDPVADIVDVLL